jgi:hypothetical protein
MVLVHYDIVDLGMRNAGSCKTAGLADIFRRLCNVSLHTA